MESEQKPADLCLICSEFMGPYKNNLDNITQFSHRTIFQMFENFITINVARSELEERQICQNCLIKFNELDEHHTIAERIQNELMTLYNQSLMTPIECKPIIKMEPMDFPLGAEYFMDENQTRKKRDRTPEKRAKKDKKSKQEEKPKKRRYEDQTGFTLEVIDGRKHFKCEICGKYIFRRLQVHRGTHSTERPVKCQECGACFKTKYCLYSHTKKHRQKLLICDYCGKGYPKRYHLRLHMASIHFNKRDYICTICGKAYAREAILINHLKYHADIKNEVCEVCGHRAYTKASMYRHMKTHTRERNYSCDICGKTFVHRYNVTAHKNHVHFGVGYPKVDEAKLTCSICGQRFPRQNRVKQHMLEVHGGTENNTNYVVEALDEFGDYHQKVEPEQLQATQSMIQHEAFMSRMT